jgi:hypothetical protein
VVDDPIDHLIIRDKGEDLHRTATFGTDHGVNFKDLADHLGPAFGRDGPHLRLGQPQNQRRDARLPDLPPVGIGVQAVIADGDLAFVGNRGDDPADERLSILDNFESYTFRLFSSDSRLVRSNRMIRLRILEV